MNNNRNVPCVHCQQAFPRHLTWIISTAVITRWSHSVCHRAGMAVL